MAKRIKLEPVDIKSVVRASVLHPPIELLEVSMQSKEVRDYLSLVSEMQQAIKNMASPRFAKMFSRRLPFMIEGYLSSEDFYEAGVGNKEAVRG